MFTKIRNFFGYLILGVIFLVVCYPIMSGIQSIYKMDIPPINWEQVWPTATLVLFITVAFFTMYQWSWSLDWTLPIVTFINAVIWDNWIWWTGGAVGMFVILTIKKILKYGSRPAAQKLARKTKSMMIFFIVLSVCSAVSFMASFAQAILVAISEGSFTEKITMATGVVSFGPIIFGWFFPPED